MKKFLVIILLCIGFTLHAQEYKIIYYSDCYTRNTVLYSRPTLIIVSDIDIKVVDAKIHKIIDVYTWVASKIEEDKTKSVIRYRALDDLGRLYNLALAHYYNNNETVFGIQETDVIYRRLKQL